VQTGLWSVEVFIEDPIPDIPPVSSTSGFLLPPAIGRKEKGAGPESAAPQVGHWTSSGDSNAPQEQDGNNLSSSKDRPALSISTDEPPGPETSVSTISRLIRMDDLKDYPTRKMWAIKFIITVVTMATVVMSAVAECVRHTFALQAQEAGEQHESLAELEAAVWSRWAPWRWWVLYEVKSLANSTSSGAVVIYIALLGIGCRKVRRHVFICTVLGSGLSFWGLQLAARSLGTTEYEVTAKIMKAASYGAALFGWFVVLPLVYLKTVKKLRRGWIFPLAVFNLLLALAALIADRVFHFMYLQVVLLGAKCLELVVAIPEGAFHDLGHMLALMSFFIAYPIGLIWAWRQMQQQSLLDSTGQTFVITTFTLGAKAHVYFIARGSVTHHQRSVVVFPMQLLEHFWTKCVLAATPVMSLDFLGASLVAAGSLGLQSTQHGRKAARFLLTPLVRRSTQLKFLLGELLLVDQPAWKALMLIEHEVFRANHNVFANLLATMAAALVVVLQWMLESGGASLQLAFNLGRGSKEHFIVAWGLQFVLHSAIAFAASRSRSSYVASVQRHFHENVQIDGEAPGHPEANPSRPTGPKHARTLQDFSEPQLTTPTGESVQQFSLTFPSESSKASQQGPARQPKRTHLERYIRESSKSLFHERFETFKQLSPTRPAFLMDPNTYPWSFHNTLIARYFGYFVASSVFIITQTLYMLALTTELIGD